MCSNSLSIKLLKFKIITINDLKKWQRPEKGFPRLRGVLGLENMRFLLSRNLLIPSGIDWGSLICLSIRKAGQKSKKIRGDLLKPRHYNYLI